MQYGELKQPNDIVQYGRLFLCGGIVLRSLNIFEQRVKSPNCGIEKDGGRDPWPGRMNYVPVNPDARP